MTKHNNGILSVIIDSQNKLNVNQSFRIYEMLKNKKDEISVLVDGFQYSAGLLLMNKHISL